MPIKHPFSLPPSSPLISHGQIKDALAAYGNPRMKVSRMLVAGELIPLRRGLFLCDRAVDLRALRRINLSEDAVVFLGDDATDEDVFRELGPTAITMHVGSATAPSHARLNAHDPEDAVLFLDTFASLFDGP